MENKFFIYNFFLFKKSNQKKEKEINSTNDDDDDYDDDDDGDNGIIFSYLTNSGAMSWLSFRKWHDGQCVIMYLLGYGQVEEGLSEPNICQE
ncbi:hypothetical protein BpHYR1_001808 [Brachionus plicatilis]|uniref:Uncharacterized protein n=1 Tax=Brachionus plicatilis TaxID=10195 RepID=A0A3M7S7Z2_BRAPC|nr:hypothetical protein BpHYR1_001808 [Brachionus plicatilis]